METKIKIAYASGKNTNTTLTTKELTLEELSQWFEDPQEGQKNTVGYFIRGGDMVVTNEGTPQEHYHRNNKSLLSADLLVLDIDKGNVTPKEMSGRLTELQFSFIIYTSPSHTKELPRYRVILCCRMPSIEYLKPSLSAFRQLLDLEAKPSAGEEGNWSNPWYFPVRTPDYQFLFDFSGKEVPAISALPENQNQDFSPSTSFSSKQTFDEQLKNIVEGKKDSKTHESIRDFIYGQLKDGISSSSILSILKALTSRPDYPHSDYIPDFERQVKAATKKLKVKYRTEWEDLIPLPLAPTPNNVPFPVEHVPESLKQSAKAISDFNCLDESDIYLVLVGIISSSINRKAQIEVGTKDLIVYFHLGIIHIAETGEFKSTVYKQCSSGLVRGDGDASKVYNDGKHQRSAEIAFLERELKFLTKAPGKDDSDLKGGDILKKSKRVAEILKKLEDIKYVRKPKTIVDDATQESASDTCFWAGGTLNYFAPEGQSFFANLKDQYGKATAKTDIVIRILTGDSYSKDRKGDDTEVKMNAVGNVNVWVQNDIYYDFVTDPKVFSSGFSARIIPNPWRKLKKHKTKENLHFRQSEVQEFNDRIFHLSKYRPSNTEFVYQIEDDPHPLMSQPVTCIKSFRDESVYMDLFNDLWNSIWDDKDRNKQTKLNKVISNAYIIASCLYAYKNYDTFYLKKEHTTNRVFMNSVKGITKYLIDKIMSSHESEYEKKVLDLSRKIISFLEKSTNLSDFKMGLTTGKFDNKLKSYGGGSFDPKKSELYSDALVQLEEHNYIKCVPDPSTGKLVVYVNTSVSGNKK